jgi:hypothetical protein
MQTQGTDLTAEARLELLDRVLGSKTFARAPRLTAMLRYVCEQSLYGRDGNRVTERQIGIHVFGRPEDYNPMEDNIVRSTGRLLRQKLQDYFEGEGREERLRIEIPKGKYVPEFVGTEVVKPVLVGGWSRRRWMGLVGTGVAVSGAGVVASRIGSGGLLGQLWGKVLDPKRRTLVVLSDTAFALVQDMVGHAIDVTDYVGGRWRSKVVAEMGKESFAAEVAYRRYCGVVDADFAFQVARRPEAQGVEIKVRPAGDLSVQDTRGANVLVVGAAHANPWIRLMDGNGNFRVELDFGTKKFSVLNKKVVAGEPAAWKQEEAGKVYGIVSLLEKPDRDGNALLLQGASIAGTECAIDLVCREANLRALLGQAGPVMRELKPFEALFQTAYLGGNSSAPQLVSSRFYA